jgi:hypothetical protein
MVSDDINDTLLLLDEISFKFMVASSSNQHIGDLHLRPYSTSNGAAFKLL